MDVNAETEVKRMSRDYRHRLFWLVGLSALLTGCATFRDIKQDMSQWSLREKKQPWDRSPDEEFDVMGERRPSRIIARDFQPRNFLTTIRVITALGEDQKAAELAFDEGRNLYEQAAELHEAEKPGEAAPLFHQAGNQFREAAARWPDSAMEEDSLFMQGEAFFFADQYVLANRAYESLVARFSGSSYLDQVEARRFSIAQFWLRTSEENKPLLGLNLTNEMLPTTGIASEARRIFHRIRLDDPTGKLADDATMALGAAFFRAGSYQEAADAFDDLRKSYPGSPHQFNAHLFQVKSLLATYAGPDYDGAPLEKADQLLHAMVKQFPNEVEQQREYLASEGSRVRNMLADRDYQVGQYYESKGENRAAGLYYASVAERFKDTTLSDEARDRVVEVAQKDPEPVQPVAWFVDWFPEAKATRPLIPTETK